MIHFRKRAAWSGVIIAAGFIGLAVAGLVLARVESPAPAVPTARPAPPVETRPIRPQQGFERRRVSSGRVQARRASSLGFETAGRLATVHVDEGAQVDQGALLAELDTARLEARRAELDAGRAIDQLRPGERYTLIWRDRPFSARLRVLLPLRAAPPVRCGTQTAICPWSCAAYSTSSPAWPLFQWPRTTRAV